MIPRLMTQSSLGESRKKISIQLVSCCAVVRTHTYFFSTNVFRYLPKIIISKIQFAKRSQVVNKAKKYLFLLVENIHITFYYN